MPPGEIVVDALYVSRMSQAEVQNVNRLNLENRKECAAATALSTGRSEHGLP